MEKAVVYGLHKQVLDSLRLKLTLRIQWLELLNTKKIWINEMSTDMNLWLVIGDLCSLWFNGDWWMPALREERRRESTSRQEATSASHFGALHSLSDWFLVLCVLWLLEGIILWSMVAFIQSHRLYMCDSPFGDLNRWFGGSFHWWTIALRIRPSGDLDCLVLKSYNADQMLLFFICKPWD